MKKKRTLQALILFKLNVLGGVFYININFSVYKHINIMMMMLYKGSVCGTLVGVEHIEIFSYTHASNTISSNMHKIYGKSQQ